MAGKEHIQALMREIGPQMALAQVTEFEVEGTWTLMPDEDTVLFADYDEAGGRLVLSAEAGRPVDSGRLGLYDLLLRYNNSWAETGGVRMALDGEGTVVQLFDLPVGRPRPAPAAGRGDRLHRHAAGLARDRGPGRRRQHRGGVRPDAGRDDPRLSPALVREGPG